MSDYEPQTGGKDQRTCYKWAKINSIGKYCFMPAFSSP